MFVCVCGVLLFFQQLLHVSIMVVVDDDNGSQNHHIYLIIYWPFIIVVSSFIIIIIHRPLGLLAEPSTPCLTKPHDDNSAPLNNEKSIHRELNMESILVGNRTVTLEDFFKVSCIGASVQLDTASLSSIKKSAGLAKSQTAPEAHNVLDGDDAAEEERRFVVTCTKDQARATMLFHLVWFMAGRSDVRQELVETLSQLLNEDVIPVLPRSPKYVNKLMAFLSTGKDGDTDIPVFGNASLSSANIPTLGELTGFEKFAFSRDQLMETAIVCLEAYKTSSYWTFQIWLRR